MKTLILLVLFLLGVGGAAQAQIELVGTLGSSGATLSSNIFGNSQRLAQQFTLTSGNWAVSSVTTRLESFFSSTPIASLALDSGGQPGSVLESQIYSGPSLAGEPTTDIVFSGWSVTLAPGTYWLELQQSGPVESGFDWLAVDTNTPGALVNATGVAGHFEDRYAQSDDNGTSWNVDTGLPGSDPYYFQINGSVVPEPVTLGLLALGGMGLLVHRRKK